MIATFCTNSRCSLRQRCGKVQQKEVDLSVKSNIKYVFFKPSRDRTGREHCPEYIKI